MNQAGANGVTLCKHGEISGEEEEVRRGRGLEARRQRPGAGIIQIRFATDITSQEQIRQTGTDH